VEKQNKAKIARAFREMATGSWLYDLLEENGVGVKLVHRLKTRAIATMSAW